MSFIESDLHQYVVHQTLLRYISVRDSCKLRGGHLYCPIILKTLASLYWQVSWVPERIKCCNWFRFSFWLKVHGYGVIFVSWMLTTGLRKEYCFLFWIKPTQLPYDCNVRQNVLSESLLWPSLFVHHLDLTRMQQHIWDAYDVVTLWSENGKKSRKHTFFEYLTVYDVVDVQAFTF